MPRNRAPLPRCSRQRRAYVHHYHDHRTGQHRQQTLPQEEMIRRYISHIPARHFKMVRYSGFLSNRKRGKLLPKVYKALEMTARKKPENPGFSVLMKGFLRTDPYKCILCGDRLLFTGAQMGKKATELLSERLHNLEKKRWLRS
uniref:transposase n=1 Tax=Arsenophonus nasoniae TaxID=638 RepID=UPI0026A65956